MNTAETPALSALPGRAGFTDLLSDNHFDCIIVGSGFGGSVSAYRLAEKGYSVAVLEQGKRLTAADIEAGSRSFRKLMWFPRLGMRGYFSQDTLKHVSIIRGIGVGGGSLVYAAVLLRPRDPFYQDPAWTGMGIDWKRELAPFYDEAERMLGAAPNPHFDLQDEYLQKTAAAMGKGATFGKVRQGIYFGSPGQVAPDPYFEGRGPERVGCNLCGACITACNHNAKNTLDKNYLYLAERLGARVFAEHETRSIEPLAGGGYRVTANATGARTGGGRKSVFTADRVVVAAGVLGSVELLLRCRDRSKTLPELSPMLGRRVRTNSEALVAILSRDRHTDLTRGTTISTDFYPDSDTHVTQNRLPVGQSFAKYYLAPMVDDPLPWRRALKVLAGFLLHPLLSTRSLFARNWHKRVTFLTVMQHMDNEVSLEQGRDLFNGFRRGLVSRAVSGKKAPSYIPVANRAGREYAKVSDGEPFNMIQESLLGQSTTAHVLGGCAIGDSRQNGVIDSRHEVFGYPGLYVVDGSAVPANVGVNPSLTITALAERCMNLFPGKS